MNHLNNFELRFPLVYQLLNKNYRMWRQLAYIVRDINLADIKKCWNSNDSEALTALEKYLEGILTESKKYMSQQDVMNCMRATTPISSVSNKVYANRDCVVLDMLLTRYASVEEVERAVEANERRLHLQKMRAAAYRKKKQIEDDAF